MRCAAERLSRRTWLRSATIFPLLVWGRQVGAFTVPAKKDERRDRILGMLLGGAVGDAAGGPVEFQPPAKTADILPDCRNWPEQRRLTAADISQLASELTLHGYASLRPEPEPYGQWSGSAAPGTVTDDTRHKMVVIAALRTAQRHGVALTRELLAQEYDRVGSMQEFSRAAYSSLVEESFREFRLAARAVLGEQPDALPPVRIWGGLPTCCGQMALPPVAALHIGDPESAYRHAFRIGFFDQGTAKDINSAIVAGLATAMGLAGDKPTTDSFETVRETMLTTDPYRYADIPFIERPIRHAVELAERCVGDADGRPAKLYEALERALHPKYYWEAHFTFASAWALLKLCDWNGLAAIHLALDMGHDTDSTAQLIGMFWGAVVGVDGFPKKLSDPVERQLGLDYDVQLNDWLEILVK